MPYTIDISSSQCPSPSVSARIAGFAPARKQSCHYYRNWATDCSDGPQGDRRSRDTNDRESLGETRASFNS